MTDFVDAELRKGREALSDARTLREADGSTAGVVDWVYFAAFHAVRTVLSVRGSLSDDEDHVPAHSGCCDPLPPWRSDLRVPAPENAAIAMGV